MENYRRTARPTLTSSTRSRTKIQDEDESFGPSMSEEVTNLDSNRYSTEITLKSLGYTPVQRVTIEPNTNYLKCQSPLGFYIFVLIDDNKMVSFNANNLTAKEMMEGEVLPIPTSLTNGFYHDSGNVMVVCNKGLCKMTHDSLNVDPIITNFSLLSESKSRLLLPDGSVLAYPLVTLSELKANPKSILMSTMTATNRLREIAYLKCHDHLRLFINRLNTLSTNTNRFVKDQHELASQLDTYIKTKTTEQLELTAAPPKSSIAVEKQWNNLYNLNVRHNMIVKFLNVCAKFGDLSDKISELNSEVESLSEMLKGEFIDVQVDKQRPIL